MTSALPGVTKTAIDSEYREYCLSRAFACVIDGIHDDAMMYMEIADLLETGERSPVEVKRWKLAKLAVYLSRNMQGSTNDFLEIDGLFLSLIADEPLPSADHLNAPHVHLRIELRLQAALAHYTFSRSPSGIAEKWLYIDEIWPQNLHKKWRGSTKDEVYAALEVFRTNSEHGKAESEQVLENHTFNDFKSEMLSFLLPMERDLPSPLLIERMQLSQPSSTASVIEKDDSADSEKTKKTNELILKTKKTNELILIAGSKPVSVNCINACGAKYLEPHENASICAGVATAAMRRAEKNTSAASPELYGGGAAATPVDTSPKAELLTSRKKSSVSHDVLMDTIALDAGKASPNDHGSEGKGADTGKRKMSQLSQSSKASTLVAALGNGSKELRNMVSDPMAQYSSTAAKPIGNGVAAAMISGGDNSKGTEATWTSDEEDDDDELTVPPRTRLKLEATSAAVEPKSLVVRSGPQSKKQKRRWTDAEVDALYAGVKKYKTKWANFFSDTEIGPALHRWSQVDLKDKWRNISKK